MLKTDFNGYKEFKEKLANTSGEENANTTEAAVRTYAESNSTVLCKLNELAYMQQMSAQNHV